MSRTSVKSDVARLDRLKDRDIDYSEIPPLDSSFFRNETEAWPPANQQVAVRLDVDVLDWLKLHGKGYQTRLNRILRAAMEHQAPRRPRTPKGRARSRQRPLPHNEDPRDQSLSRASKRCKAMMGCEVFPDLSRPV